MKNSNDTIGNRNRELPACSAVPKPTALPRAQMYGCTSALIFVKCAGLGLSALANSLGSYFYNMEVICSYS